MKKVITLGTFDVIHPGHIHMLKEAKSLGDFLIAVVARDEISAQVKENPPIFDEKERLKSVKKLNIADKVILGNLGEDRYKAINDEGVDIVALGYDQVAFVDKLREHIRPEVKIIRLKPYKPEMYKSSKIKNAWKQARENPRPIYEENSDSHNQ